MNAAHFHELSSRLRKVGAEMQQWELRHPRTAPFSRMLDKDACRFTYAQKRLLAEMIAVAERAYIESPNTDSNVSEFLRSLAVGSVLDGDYAEALRLARLVIEKGSQEKEFYAAAGLAAFAIGDFNEAETYLKKGQGESLELSFLGKTLSIGNEFSGRAADCLKQIPEYHDAWQREQRLRAAEAKAGDLPHVLLKTGGGEIEVELFAHEAPKTVAHFLALVESGYYDKGSNMILERVVALAPGKKDPEDDRLLSSADEKHSIPSEAKSPQRRLHLPGSLSMVSERPKSCGPRVAVAMLPAKYLDGTNTVFGRVVRGMESLTRLQRSEIQTWCCGETSPRGWDAERILEAKVLRTIPDKGK